MRTSPISFVHAAESLTLRTTEEKTQQKNASYTGYRYFYVISRVASGNQDTPDEGMQV